MTARNYGFSFRHYLEIKTVKYKIVLASATDKSIVNDGNLIMLDIKKTAKSEKGGL